MDELHRLTRQQLVHRVHELEASARDREDRGVEERLRTIVDTASEGIVTIDETGRIEFFNAAAQRMFGYTDREVIGQDVSFLMPTPDRELHRSYIENYLRTGVRKVIGSGRELQGMRKDGSRFPVHLSIGEARIASRRYFTGFISDLSARRAAEQAFVATFENAAVGIAHVAPDGRWLCVNETLCTITGFPREELLQKTFADITHPDDLELDWQQAMRLLRGEISSYSITKRYVRRSGTPVWVELTVSLVSSPEGDSDYFITVVQDISRRKAAEMAVRQSEEHLRNILDSLFVFIGVLDPNGVLLQANRPPLDAAELRLEDVVGKKFWDCYWWNYSTVVQHQLRNAIHQTAGGLPHRCDAEIRLAGDRRITIDFMLAPMRGPAGAIEYVIASAVDISERKQLEREVLEITDRERRTIGQDLHDDLGQRLTATELLAHSLALDLEARDPTNAARATKIGAYIRDAIRVTRLLARGLAPVLDESEGICGALRELATTTREMFSKECEFTCPVPISISSPGAAVQLYRIAQESVSNAVRHGRANHIVISLDPSSDDRITLRISDDGVGFQKSRRGIEGLGLRIMQHRAGIIAASLRIGPRVGGGTEVVCTFPRTL
jgi:PAS domain S-box-containing protein